MNENELLRPVLAQMVKVIETLGEMKARSMSCDDAPDPRAVEPGSSAMAGALRFEVKEVRRLFEETFGDSVA
jgi:hypothetical protein